MSEAVSKCFPLTAGSKIKSKISRILSGLKIPDFERGGEVENYKNPGKRQSQTESGLLNPPQSPFNKGGLKTFPPLERGVRGDFEIKDISY